MMLKTFCEAPLAKGDRDMKLVLINPNTSTHVTDLMVAQARKTAGKTAQIIGVTAAFGPRIIGSRVENSLAVHGALDAAAREAQNADAIILGVSMDTALQELRDLMPMPVVGMAQSALMTAANLGARVGCVTIGPQMIPLYEEMTAGYGLADRAVWRAIDLPSVFDQSPGPGLVDALTAQCDQFVRDAGVDVLLLCGAVLTGYAPQVSANVNVPVLDCIDTATRMAMMLVERANTCSAVPARPKVAGRLSDGLGEALSDMLSRS
jgi:allantoin racemase